MIVSERAAPEWLTVQKILIGLKTRPQQRYSSALVGEERRKLTPVFVQLPREQYEFQIS